MVSAARFGGRYKLHPPPDRALPDDRAIHGSKAGTRDDSSYLAADIAAVKAYFDVRGYDFAADMLDFYLDNHASGEEYKISLENYLKVVGASVVKSKISECLDDIAEQARKDPQIGVKRELTSDWKGIHSVDDQDVANALGTFAVAVGSDTTVLAPGLLDGLRAQISFKIYIWDYYNFDQLQAGYTKPAKTLNNEARLLEELGLARSYIARGESPYSQMWTQNL
ncbi:hypothetical protein H0264_29955 [Nocardia huaxiensis]|uniref:Uncharacterized protein n=1 Tax=Nocardia huaxiensis TaxID=2755382 RepID=A0A7D6ZV21_9NOCA|nr:hypothetical protein [Nocardia huaxiensis]QLY29449.1 hypothetical protein H0264_29955 [Nocardia huaxiensis]